MKSVEDMIIYQPQVTVYRFNIWNKRWVVKDEYPATMTFEDYFSAKEYESEYISGLIRRGIKLKIGYYKVVINELIYNPKSKQ